jgi:hypothetical protein
MMDCGLCCKKRSDRGVILVLSLIIYPQRRGDRCGVYLDTKVQDPMSVRFECCGSGLSVIAMNWGPESGSSVRVEC